MKAANWMGMVMASLLAGGTVCAQQIAPPPAETLGKKERRAEIQQWREKMSEELKKQDAELEKLQQELNSASGEKKVDALTAAVNKLIDQRRQMHTQMEAVRERIHKRLQERRRGAPAQSPSGVMPHSSP